MPATAKIQDARPDSLDLYRHRDDLAQAFSPINAYERMLVTQAAQAWERLQLASNAEKRYFQDRDIADTIANRPSEFKAITRFVSECTRAWRQAVAALEKIKRDRKHDLSSPNARRNSPVLVQVAEETAGAPAAEAATQAPTVEKAIALGALSRPSVPSQATADTPVTQLRRPKPTME